MAGELASGGNSELPEGFSAVAISAGQSSSPLKICILVRQIAAGAGGHFQLLRDTLDGLIYLGCVADAAGRVKQWLELWVQDGSGLPSALPTAREAVSNLILDERWRLQVQALAAMDSAALLMTGWETINPLPTFIDLKTLQPMHPTDPQSGEVLELCRDEKVLAEAGLPGYTATLHRYLYAPKSQFPAFYPVQQNSPTNQQTMPMATVTAGQTLAAFNPGAGLLCAREALALKYTALVDFLGGSPEEETLRSGGYPIQPIGGATSSAKLATKPGAKSAAGGRGTAEESNSGYLFLGSHGKWGRALEGFHLKLCAVCGAVKSVREYVRQMQLPMLNITADSFRVQLGGANSTSSSASNGGSDTGARLSGLPWLWTANVSLVTAGDVVELPLKSGETKYYLQGRDPGMSVYRPPAVVRAARGRGVVRIRQVISGDGSSANQVILLGTLSAPDSMSVGRHDLVWMRLTIAGQRLDLYAHLESAVALTAGESRFRTLGQQLPDQVAAQLKSAEGASIPDVMFDVLPSMNTPCDVYALGVLGVRTLLVNGQRTLPVALDELLSLARQVASDAAATLASGGGDKAVTVPLPQRIAEIFKRDARWLASLGPQHLVYEPIPVEEAFDLIPEDLWYETLATLIRMFPGVGPDSDSTDYGQGRAGGLHHTFDCAAENLTSLLQRSRSLIVIDWKFNREIDSILRRRLTKAGSGLPGLAAQPAPAAVSRSVR